MKRIASGLSLTDRQQVLFDRLVTLGEWAASGELPLQVLEILGFGSFFRGKDRPKDVDLILRVQRPDFTPQFSHFKTLLDKIRYDQSYQQQFETPKDALLSFHERQYEARLPGFDDGSVERRRLGEWLEGFSWRMLHPSTIPEQSALEAPEEYTTRLIKRCLPNLNVIRFLNPDAVASRPPGLRCGFTVSVWSGDAPDTAANLRHLLSEEVVAQNLRRELMYFGFQRPLAQAKAILLRAEIDALFTIPRRRKAVTNPWRRSDELLGKRAELREPRRAFEEAQQAADQFDSENWAKGAASPTADKSVELDAAAAEADRLRKEIKRFYQRIDILEDIHNLLVRYKAGLVPGDLPPKEFVVTEMLNHGGVARRQRVAEFLEEMGLPAPKRLLT